MVNEGEPSRTGCGILVVLGRTISSLTGEEWRSLVVPTKSEKQ